MQTAKAIKISNNTYWVGAIDWGLRDFHGYNTSRGSTYNAYLVDCGGKFILVDTVKSPFFDEMLSRISSITNLSQIEIIISNHSEMDHSGSLPQAVEAIKPQKVICSKNGADALKLHFQPNFELTPVSTGETISIGNKKITFIETKMLHWPDSMFSYLHEDKILFSQDAFGMHLASAKLFADEIDESILTFEAEKYFANILLPYSQLVLKLIADLPKLNLDIQVIAPDHGPIWRKNPEWIIKLYKKCAEQKPQNKAIIAFDTMWGSTSLMAKAIAHGLEQGGTDYKLLGLNANHRSDVATELLDAGAMILGSPTINNNIFPTVADLICYLKGLRPTNKITCAFGSYGWSGEATKILNSILQEMKLEIINNPITAKYRPDQNTLLQCVELGKKISDTLKNKIQQ